MNNTNFGLSTIIMIALLGVSAYLLKDILVLSNKRQEIENDKAILGSVRYGLFSVHEWKSKVTVVLNKKIDEFELNDDNRGEINQKLEQMLNFALDEVEKIMNERANQSIMGAFQSAVASFAIDINDLRRRVPEIASQAMLQLGDENTMLNLKIFLKRKLSEYLDRTIGKGDRTIFDETLTKYNCTSIGAVNCISNLEIAVKNLESSIWKKSLYLILAIIGIFILILLNKTKEKPQLYIGILSCLVLLIAGVLTPMIDLDARIKQVKFLLMNEPITFDEQMLFYQSKSIIDVFIVLIKSGQIESIIISVLVLLFSVVFPILKLLCSYFYINNPINVNNKIINFFVFKSGKWSMADVIVVAIFMSFIGFRGIINSQLSKLNTINENIEVITTNDTQLQAGFMTFTFFCLASIFLSSILTKFHNNIK